MLARVLAIVGWGIAGFFGSLVFFCGVSGILAGIFDMPTEGPSEDSIVHVWILVSFGVSVIMLVLGVFGRLPVTRARIQRHCPDGASAYRAGPLADRGIAGPPPEPLRISYQNTSGDVAAFQFYGVIHSPLALIIWGILIINLCRSALTGSAEEGVLARIGMTILAALAGIAAFIVTTWLTSIALPIIRRKRGVLTRHTLTFTDTDLIEETDYNRTETPWAKVVKVRRTLNHLFIYVTRQSAHVIPRRAVPEADWNKLYEYCRGKVRPS